MNSIKDKVSVLVCSCDAYSDLWYPFFKLYQKYWTIPELNLYLNTETKDYSYEGLNIRCVHPNRKNAPYGERMRDALSQIDTEYVITFLDDFFIREYVDDEHIRRIIEWMDEDKSIVCFNQDCLKTYSDWEIGEKPGYRRIPWGTEYTLNMQVAVWRTKKLKNYWKNDVSPWEWEEFCNALTYGKKREKFYCLTDYSYGFCNYGFNINGMGVYHGKWVMDDVVPLFEKENICVDYSVRGEYDKNDVFPGVGNKKEHRLLVKSCLGKTHLIKYHIYCLKKKKFKKIRTTPKRMFYHYIEDLKIKTKEDFLKYYSKDNH